jgi:hypothetical protein
MIAVWEDVSEEEGKEEEGKEEERKEESVGNRCESWYISFYQDRKPESRVSSDVGEFKKGKLAGRYTTMPILPSASSVIRQSSTFLPLGAVVP